MVGTFASPPFFFFVMSCIRGTVIGWLDAWIDRHLTFAILVLYYAFAFINKCRGLYMSL